MREIYTQENAMEDCGVKFNLAPMKMLIWLLDYDVIVLVHLSMFPMM